MMPLPPQVNALVAVMEVEEKPDVIYSDIGGCEEQIKKLREVVELPLLDVSAFIDCFVSSSIGLLSFSRSASIDWGSSRRRE